MAKTSTKAATKVEPKKEKSTPKVETPKEEKELPIDDTVYETSLDAVDAAYKQGLNFTHVKGLVDERAANRLAKKGILVGDAVQDGGSIKTLLSWQL